MITAWRICKKRFSGEAFSGTGAAEFPGRWNRTGKRMVYCAESRALAAMEVLAHVGDKSLLACSEFVVCGVTIPSALVYKPGQLPKDWANFPESESTRHFGCRFLEEMKFPAMRVPSVVVSGEFNYLLNPLHPDFPKLRIGQPMPFFFDARLRSN